ncbi:PKD domain-containing protein, partial [Candidatus Peregrinibacteria bacterium]|nr:PKD domain-containing protein [Candidatus Peregrinibacteria bacterium]
MAEEKEPKNTNDIKKQTTQDFEMGEEEEEKDIQAPKTPKINNYMKDIKESGEAQSTQPEVKPEAEAPPTPPPPQPRQTPEQTATPPSPRQLPPQQPTPPPAPGKTIGEVKGKQTVPTAPPVSGKKPPGKKARKKAMLGCLGAFGGIMILYLLFAFIFIAQANEEVSPIARLLGVDQASFVNGLITSVHIVFILVSLVTFVFTMIGLFKASTAKKGDKAAKKSGLKMSLIAGLTLIFIFILWFVAYIYLDAKRIQVAPEVKQPIITEPEETLNLTAPIEIKFDASNVPIDKQKFQIISYEWDFGDDETGTSQIVAHQYDKKGRYDVLLTVTKRNKNTGEEFQDQYSVIVSIANQALTATFTADPQSGPAPLEVEFDAGESVDPDGTIDRYEWDLDEDGEYDDDEGVNITYEFEKIGRYLIGLRVVSTTGEYAVTEKEIIVEEEKLPEAKITVVDEPETYIVGINYVFKADESTSPNGKIEEYEWDFSDGTPVEITKTVSHSFFNEGTYEVKLAVTDEEDMEGETTKAITVGAPAGSPEAVIKTEPALEQGELSLTGTLPFTVVFDASETTDSDNNIVDYEWDFNNDGTTDEYGETATHTYTSEGTYTAELTVTDADGNTGTATRVIKVESRGIVAVLEADKIEGNVPLTVSFDASGSSYDEGQITTYRWNFGDGTTPIHGTSTITHKYTEIGNYTATVTIVGSDNKTAEDSVNITIREIPLEACFVSVFE